MCWLAWESTHSPAELALPVPWACILLCHGDRVAAASHLTFCLFVCVAETKGSLQRRASGAEPRRSPTRAETDGGKRLLHQDNEQAEAEVDVLL